LACKYLIFLPISELASVKQRDNSLLLSKNTKNTWKTKKAVASSETNLQSKHDRICHVAKVKAATSAHSMADVIPFFSVFIIPLESNALIKPKENIFCTQKRKQYP